MHGVGCQWVLKAFSIFNHNKPNLVECQCKPDPNFSTVVFPNPEEKGNNNIY